MASSSDSTGVQALSGLGVELLHLCVGCLSVFNLTHARVMWESGTSIEKMPTSDRLVGKPFLVRIFSD